MLLLERISGVRCQRLWDLFAEALEAKGITRKDVMEATGVSLYKVDHGRVPRDWATVKKVGEFLGLDLRELYRRWWLARRLKSARKVRVPRAEPVSEKEWRSLVEKARALYQRGTSIREIMKRAKREGWLERLRVALPDAERDAHRVTLAVFGVRTVEELRCSFCGFVPKLDTLYNYYLRPRKLGDKPWEEWECRQCPGVPVRQVHTYAKAEEKIKRIEQFCRDLEKAAKGKVRTKVLNKESFKVNDLLVRVVWWDLIKDGIYRPPKDGSIIIYQDEFLDKREITLSRLLDLLGCSGQRLHARSLRVEGVSHKDAVLFLQRNHLMGNVNTPLNLALVDSEGEIVVLATFQRGRRPLSQSKETWELVRFCTKIGYHVPGALSRLIKHFFRVTDAESVISFVDLRWSSGKGYEKAGAKFLTVTKPNYYWVDPHGNRAHRFRYRKDRLPDILGKKFDPDLSETQNLLRAGYKKVFDRGHAKFVFERL